ncbi:LPXTG cell wall anchor domain-containing protein [Staphylococcus hominis]|uniref:LPXTG cell wall anchor domain-containing protein n=1 Tax=Staphylococcus hominis TaxID=1290 RepID=UPI0022E033FD|nr:LPXTG cell wall anchor domain-containing protein [Staphylococcus hominis]
MKKSKVLATTTLAGALLFTGVGATHHANAAEGQLSDAQILNTANQYIDNQHILLSDSNYTQIASKEWVPVPDGYTPVAFAERNSQAPSYIFVNNKTGEVIDRGQGHHVTYTPNHETTTQKTTQDTQANNNTQSTTNNNVAANNEATTNNATTTTTNNTTSTQSNEAQALPETGEESSNTTLVTIIASVLLAAGSLLAFRRTSNSK